DDDKDRVIIRSNGSPTYFAADIGYVTEKRSRGFDHLIYVWGADHHGTIARLRGAAEAMGYDAGRVQILLYSWVRFVRDGVEISMSKRSGEFITLDELLAEVGVDAARWFFASRAATTGIDFDIELAKKQSAENPVRAEETQGITAYATELATTFHGFYRDARVVDPDEPERSAARLALADAARITLSNALTLLGISAPESL